jgi:beta-lactamase regulating signal transducer with metallopeptidase domain
MLGNAAVAAGLALVALAVGYVCRSPAVRYAAWLLVLLKLVTPPLVGVPLPVLPASWAEPEPASKPPTPLLTVSAPVLADTGGPLSGVAAASPSWWDRVRSAGAGDWALAVWVIGSAGWFAWQCRRVVRFRRGLQNVRDADPEVTAAAARIGKALNLSRVPAVKVATGIGSPMLWGVGRGTVVLFPRELLARLDPEARDTLLAHELAHYRRRDHWVRVLEFAATGLYWWHPAVWLARTGIEAAEEECCDAWVVGGVGASPRRYAEALLATVDFIAEARRPCLPPGACGANRGIRLLYRRLAGIMHAAPPGSGRGATAGYALIGAVLLLQPVLRAASPDPDPAAPSQNPAAAYHAARPGLPACPAPRASAEPPAWATAPAPGAPLTAIARDHEVVLRRADGKVYTLGPGKPVALAFAPGGGQVATAGPGMTVRTWDDHGRVKGETYVAAAARAIAYTPDGTRLLVLDAAGGVSVLDPATLVILATWTVEGPANSIACSPDGNTVAIAFGSWLDADTGWVELWSIADRRKVTSFPATAPVGATRFAPDGRTLVIGSWDGTTAWRSLPGGELTAERQLPKNLVAAAAFSPDAATLPLDPPPLPPPPPDPETVPGFLPLPGRVIGP